MSDSKLFGLRVSGDRVDVSWRGRWEETTAEDYAKALTEAYAAGKVRHLVVDATELDYCSILARGRLADLQTQLKSKHERCAYVASSARMRGLCLWIIQVAEDENARACARVEEVREWLQSTEGRVERAKRRTGSAFDRIRAGEK